MNTVKLIGLDRLVVDGRNGLNLARDGLVVVDGDQGHGDDVDDDKSGPGHSRRWFNLT